MRKVLTAEERYLQMTETPIPRLVITLAIPTVISMLITAVYNLADTFFVGKISLGGTSATGAVGVVFSLMAIIQAIGFTLGMGSGNYISRLLGEKNQSAAEKVAAHGMSRRVLSHLLRYSLPRTFNLTPWCNRYHFTLCKRLRFLYSSCSALYGSSLCT